MCSINKLSLALGNTRNAFQSVWLVSTETLQTDTLEGFQLQLLKFSSRNVCWEDIDIAVKGNVGIIPGNDPLVL